MIADESLNCDTDNEVHIIRATTSSLTQAPSWSLGFGAEKATSNSDHQSEPKNTSTTNSHNNVGNLGTKLSCPSVQVEIPTVYLTKSSSAKCASRQPAANSSSSSSFHVYQLKIKTSNNVEWSVYRRYSQFLALHQKLRSLEPSIGKFTFPPKRRIGSKASTIVQERRRALEAYMSSLFRHLDLNVGESPSESEVMQFKLVESFAKSSTSDQLSTEADTSLADSLASATIAQTSNSMAESSTNRVGRSFTSDSSCNTATTTTTNDETESVIDTNSIDDDDDSNNIGDSPTEPNKRNTIDGDDYEASSSAATTRATSRNSCSSNISHRQQLRSTSDGATVATDSTTSSSSSVSVSAAPGSTSATASAAAASSVQHRPLESTRSLIYDFISLHSSLVAEYELATFG